MLCNDVKKLSYFACNLGILRKKILLMPYGNDVKMYKIMIYQTPPTGILLVPSKTNKK